MSAVVMNTKQQELLETTLTTLRAALRSLRPNESQSFGQSDAGEDEGGEPANDSGGGSARIDTSRTEEKGTPHISQITSPPALEESTQYIVTAISSIEECMREIQAAAFSQAAGTPPPEGSRPFTTFTPPAQNETRTQRTSASDPDAFDLHSNVEEATMLSSTHEAPSVILTGDTTPKHGLSMKREKSPRNGSFNAPRVLSPRDDGSLLTSQNNPQGQSGAWQGAVEEGEVDEDVAAWLSNNYATKYHREATGFEVKLARSNSMASMQILRNEDGEIGSPRLAGTTSGDDGPKSPAKDMNATVAMYARTATRSHPAFCSARRYKQLLSQHEIDCIEDINSPEFDIFELHDQMGDDVFTAVCMNILCQYNFMFSLQLNIRKLVRFLRTIQALYRSENPYHNACHAADVLQTTNVYLCTNSVKENFSDVELFAVLFSALTHDVGHVGISNAFLIAIRHPLARMHNDRSPLESMHINLAFEILELEDCNFFADSATFTAAHYRDFKGLVTHAVLGTDMKFHSDMTQTAQDILEDGQIDDDEVRDLFRSIVHAADLSNPMKPLRLYLKWADRVLAEFWQQGDEERRRGLPISMMCDRSAANVAKSQLGFINFIVKPFMQELSPLLPAVWMERLKENAIYMENLTGADEAERIASITRLAERRWQEVEDYRTYHSVYHRLLSKEYTHNPHHHPPSQRASAVTSRKNSDLTLSPAGVSISGPRGMLSARNSEYQKTLLQASDDIVSRLLPSATEMNPEDSPLPKASGSSTSPPSPGRVSFDAAIAAPAQRELTDGFFMELCQEWLEIALEIQLDANAYGKNLTGTLAFVEELIPSRLLLKHVQVSEEHEEDLVFELSPELVEQLLDDGKACVKLVRALLVNNTRERSNSITFGASTVDPIEFGKSKTTEDTITMATHLRRMTRAWVALFDALRRPHLSDSGSQSQTPVSTTSHPEVKVAVSSSPFTPSSTPPSAIKSPKTTSTSIGKSSPKENSSLPLVEHLEFPSSNGSRNPSTLTLASISMGLSSTDVSNSAVSHPRGWAGMSTTSDIEELTSGYLRRTTNKPPTVANAKSQDDWRKRLAGRRLPPIEGSDVPRSQSVEPGASKPAFRTIDRPLPASTPDPVLSSTK